mmetsp:Transcript_46488/g.46961  ORF Transcript_46488/g.46961 Transcript_46488/m.46961 type:complete len:87 (+) Transcript_46488:153-413(+)
MKDDVLLTQASRWVVSKGGPLFRRTKCRPKMEPLECRWVRFPSAGTTIPPLGTGFELGNQLPIVGESEMELHANHETRQASLHFGC